jgi:Tfp pilus assembly PilM family ATPase
MNLLSLLRTPPPDVAIEITPRHVVAVAIDGDRPGRFRMTGYTIASLPPGAVTPALNAANISRPADVAQAITRAWGALGRKPKRVALVVPDGVAKVSFIRFATVPGRGSDLDDLIRFQVRKAAPFRIEDAQISSSPGVSAPDGQEYVVVQARRDIVAEYEQVCAAAGAYAGTISLATFSVVNAVLGSGSAPSGDWLLIHVDADAATLAIMRGEHMVFFRHRGADGEGHLAELVHQTAMYYQDRLGGLGFARALVAGALPDDEQGLMKRAFETRLGVPVEHIDPTRTVPLADRIGPSSDLVDALTPALGLALAQHL